MSIAIILVSICIIFSSPLFLFLLFLTILITYKIRNQILLLP